MEEQFRQNDPPEQAGSSRDSADVRRRRAALSAFLHDPEAAAGAFPDLLEDLKRFFQGSTNPFADSYDDRIAKEGSAQSFEEWCRAVAWSSEADGA